MKMMQGAFFLACSNMSRTRLAPTPTNISTKSEPEMVKNGTLASPATERARSVLPVPGGPTSNTPRTSSILIRSALPAAQVLSAVQKAVQSIDNDQPVLSIETAGAAMKFEQLFHRIFSSVFGLLASIGLVLSAVGVYGVMAYAVTQRTQEIGVRMAIGAGRAQVSWIFLKRCLWQLALGLAIGYVWHLWFPINKRLWTSSYVLVAGGYSALLLALFYQVIDVWKLQRWAFPFFVIGANAIAVYMAVELIPFDEIARRLVGGDVADWLGRFAVIVAAFVQLALAWLLVWWLYSKRIFIRI